ncbi:MAG TPA: phage tail tip lysozyme [Candidatus Saccharibacteria bacterium]|nr:phage tail tip lysozyme [Candidatus Saccharibacteria bacterium]
MKRNYISMRLYKVVVYLTIITFIVTLISPVINVSALNKFYSGNGIVFFNENDATCAAVGSDVTSLSGNDNREKIWNYLTARGLSPEQAAGVLGNIQSESGGTFSPTVQEFGKQFGESGYGIVQWTGGRRDNLVAQLQKEHPELMSKYYNVDYSTDGKSYTDQSQGFVSKNATTGELMPISDNDALLLTELNFLYQESTNRIINSAGITNSYGAETGDTEWEALKKQTTIDGASNVWVYSFEIPANVDTTAIARINNAKSIYDVYSNAESGSVCLGDGNKKSLAQQLINSPNLTFEDPLDKKLIADIASGSNNGNDFPCGMNINMLKILVAIINDGHKQRVNDLNRGCKNSTAGGLSTTSSRHYAGNGSAVDFGPIDGMASYSVAGANLILKYAAPYLVNDSGVGQSQSSCLPTSKLSSLPSGIQINRFEDGCTHLHIDIPPNVDPSLKCKVPINYGGCDKSQQV